MKLDILVQPRASKSGIVGWQGGALKVRLSAPPVDGEANAALVEVLAKELGLKKNAIRLASGPASRRKTVEITVADESALKEKLKAYGTEAAGR